MPDARCRRRTATAALCVQPVRAAQGDDAGAVFEQRLRHRPAQIPGRARQQRGLALEREKLACLQAHQQLLPPSMTRLAPVMYEEASEQRKRSALSYSPAEAMRPSGIN